jgi:hypothetical protein
LHRHHQSLSDVRLCYESTRVQNVCFDGIWLDWTRSHDRQISLTL